MARRTNFQMNKISCTIKHYNTQSMSSVVVQRVQFNVVATVVTSATLDAAIIRCRFVKRCVSRSCMFCVSTVNVVVRLMKGASTLKRTPRCLLSIGIETPNDRYAHTPTYMYVDRHNFNRSRVNVNVQL